jgi:hypothetical protein
MAPGREAHFLIAQSANEEVVMVVWCLVLFGLGAAAFLDTQYNYGLIFRQVNAVLFMSISLAILYRITTKVRIGERETLEARLAEAQDRIASMNAQMKTSGDDAPSASGVLTEAVSEPQEELNTAQI